MCLQEAARSPHWPGAQPGGVPSAALLGPSVPALTLNTAPIPPIRFEEGHIPGARHAYVGELEERLSPLSLRTDAPVAVTCSVGHRAGLATRMLLRRGFRSVSNVLGGMTAWRKLDLPVREGAPEPVEAAPAREEPEEQLAPPSPS